MNDSSSKAQPIAEAWLSEMQECVRQQDFERCRALFDDDVIGFGSKEAIAVGLDSLERDQWRQVWPQIRDFTFDLDRLQCGVSDNGMWLACPWTSRKQVVHGGWAERPGRMTAILKYRNGTWRAVHTHHSLNP